MTVLILHGRYGVNVERIADVILVIDRGNSLKCS